jgi:hypothetical protein
MAIAAKAAECARHLEKVTQAATSEEARQDWENQIFRFNLWSGNNFVFAPTRASMDWRLRNAAVLESSMCELLDDLQSSLIRASATMKTESIQEEANQHDTVSTTLEELFRLSRAVRRSGILRRFVKIGYYMEYDENGVNLTEEFRNGVERVVQFRLKHAPASEDLKRRLVDTICLRQQHFAYLRAKWEKAKPKPRDTITAPVITKSTLGATFSVRGSIPSSTNKMPKKEMIATRTPVRSMMTATTAQPQRVRRERSIKSAVSMEHEEVEYSHNNLPLPPKIPLHAVEYECPFCYMVCSSGEFSGERWKKHIVQDIMPFFCILDTCRTPNALYESGWDWVKHMKTEHVQGGWTCMDESHNETLFFKSDSAFKEHMVSCHEDAFSDDELDGIADASYLRVPVDSVINVCPFCPIDPQVNVPTEKIITHVAEHLLSFAQISLSWQMEREASDSQSFSDWSSQDQPEDSFSKYITPQKGRPNKVVRRVRNPYHGLHELAKERVARGYHYITYRSNVSAERQPPDSPDFEDEYATDPEYIPELEDLPDVDENICNLLWQSVREELHLPPLDHQPPDWLYAFQVQGTDYNEPHTLDTSTTNLHRPRSRSRSRSSSRSRHTLRDVALGAAIGISAIPGAKSRYYSQSRSRSPRKSKSRQSSFSHSSFIGIAQPARKSARFGSSFTASSENRKKRQTKKRKGISFLNIASSSSSADDDLVLGSVNARRSPKSKKNGKKKDSALLGLSATASAVPAAYHHQGQWRGETLAGKDSRSGPYDYTSSATSSDVWEDVDSEGQSSSSVKFAPAFRESGRLGSVDSPTRTTAGPESNNRVNRYDNGYLHPIGSQVGNVRRHSESPPQPRMLRRQGSLDTFDRLPSRRIDEDFRERGRPPKRTNDEVIADPESLDKEKVEKLKYPRKGKTRMPRELVHTGVIREYGYPYEEEGNVVIIQLALSDQQINALIARSCEVDPEAAMRSSDVYADDHEYRSKAPISDKRRSL